MKLKLRRVIFLTFCETQKCETLKISFLKKSKWRLWNCGTNWSLHLTFSFPITWFVSFVHGGTDLQNVDFDQLPEQEGSAIIQMGLYGSCQNLNSWGYGRVPCVVWFTFLEQVWGFKQVRIFKVSGWFVGSHRALADHFTEPAQSPGARENDQEFPSPGVAHLVSRLHI